VDLPDETEGCYDVLVVEEHLVSADVVGEWPARAQFVVDFYGELPSWMESGITLVLYQGRRAGLKEIVRRKSPQDLASRIMLVRLGKKPGKHSAGFIPSKAAREKLAEAICDGKSDVVNLILAAGKGKKRTSSPDWGRVTELLTASADKKKAGNKEKIPRSEPEAAPEEDEPPRSAIPDAMAGSAFSSGGRSTAKPPEPVSLSTTLSLRKPELQSMLSHFKAIVDDMSKEKASKAQDEGPKIDICNKCHKEDFDMSVCDLCAVVTYCGEKCLKEDWLNHEKECRDIHDSRTADLIGAVRKLEIAFK
jgi:hypothetical protein